MKIAFDCDGTLRDYNDNPNFEVIAMLRLLAKAGHHIVVWSGGGSDYARVVARAVGVSALVKEFRSKMDGGDIDLAFDDENVNLATTNVRIKKDPYGGE